MRLPRLATAILVLLSCIGVLASSLALWATLTLFDTDRFESLAGETIEQPEVTAALHDYLTSQILVLVDADDRVLDALPDRLAGLAPAIEGGIETVVSNAVTRLLESDRIQQLLVDAIGTAHASLMRLLDGDGLTGDGLTVEDGTVTFNSLPVIDRGLRALQDAGIISEDRDLPTLSSGTDPSQQIEELADSFNVDLPDDFGQFTLYSSERLAQRGEVLQRVRDGITAMKRAVVLLIVATIVLIAVALYTSTRRWRTLAQLGLGIAASMVLVRVAIDRLVSVLPARIASEASGAANDTNEKATRSILETLSGQVRTMATVLVIIALLVVCISLIMGPGERAGRLRARVASARDRAGGGTSRIAAQHADLVRVVTGIACVAILVVGELRWWSIIVASLLGGIVLIATARLDKGAADADQVMPSG